MSAFESKSRRLSRRELLRVIGLSGLTAAATSIAGHLPVPVLADSAQDETPEGFLAWAYTQRARAMSTRTPGLLEAIYDPANTQLLGFEKDRVDFFADLGSRWNGTLLGFHATVALISLDLNDSVAAARIYERVRVHWVPEPASLPSTVIKERQRNLGLFSSGVPRGPSGEIISVLGTRHEVMLVKGNRSWRLAQDAYEEPDLHGASPDLVPGSWAAVWSGFPSNGRMRISASPPTASMDGISRSLPLTTYNYDRYAAVNYANDHCASYNQNYCNYSGCGGDCANFVSQCFRAGGQVDGGNWYTFDGACGNCGTTSPNAGTNTWANNRLLRNWVINSGRGEARGDIYQIGAGDIVNYDWGGDGIFDHVAIVVESAGGTSSGLVSSHTVDRCRVPWTLGGAESYGFTHLYSSYDA